MTWQSKSIHCAKRVNENDMTNAVLKYQRQMPLVRVSIAGVREVARGFMQD